MTPLKPGILPDQQIQRLIEAGCIQSTTDISAGQLQPASLDLTLGPIAYRLRASFLPGPDAKVEDKISLYALHEINIKDGAVLERGCVYLVPLREQLCLPQEIKAIANPKSSTGRLDIFTRLIGDESTLFDHLPESYDGPLYLEICPQTFSILVREGTRLNQMRFKVGDEACSDQDLINLHREQGLVDGEPNIDGGLGLSVDLSHGDESNIIGYRAKRHSDLIDVEKKAAYNPSAFWEPIRVGHDRHLILDPNEFYILSSKEAVRIPPMMAAEMVPYNPLVGEFRVHYAGFFDPGFGHQEASGEGARAVLEVRSHEVPFLLEDGQIVCRLKYDRLAERPQSLYGLTGNSNYQRQGLKLSKHFREWQDE